MKHADLLTTAEAAIALGKSVATLNRWASTGRIIPALEFPGEKGARLFAPAEVERVRASLAPVSTEAAS